MLSLSNTEQIALNFLMEEWELSSHEREWFLVVNSRKIPESWWSIVEIGLKDLPDKWVIQVYDDGECDPCYTFVSPFSNQNLTAHLAHLPEKIAIALEAERKGYI
ncbi:conserved hypothetical protein [Gloeothece citriformis PCC 7424]|uniref:Uncharacterized protein n=1 Tax=Gloeothece citriformis (strain PCC 7424) TaxID=65393 RepID=B7KIW8_GLOC7|nr:hypothetical protein [Gloeothece citriformis]ACK70804.1 conserved hypothetical protein [Gloeothece citriformis PCC 7424]